MPAHAGQANVFVYHRFDDPRYPSTNITIEDFRSHLEILKNNSFEVMTLGEIANVLQTGGELPERCAAITIDDAYNSFLENGWPLLKTYGFQATLFVSTDSVGGGDYLDWQQLKRLAAEGVEIGNHSAAHGYMLDFYDQKDAWSQSVDTDLQRSQQDFRENLGFAPSLFAYPYGEFSPELAGLVRQAGFVAAFGQQSGVITSGQDMFTLPRFPMGDGFASAQSFRNKLFMKALPVKVTEPKSPIIKDKNPPTLTFSLSESAVAADTLRCFIPGHSECHVKRVDGEAGLYEVSAEQPLEGRRSKYTVTASDMRGRNWFWYSQLWVFPITGPVADHPVSRREEAGS